MEVRLEVAGRDVVEPATFFDVADRELDDGVAAMISSNPPALGEHSFAIDIIDRFDDPQLARAVELRG